MKIRTLISSILLCCAVLPASLHASAPDAFLQLAYKSSASDEGQGADSSGTEKVLGKLMDAASRKELERYKALPMSPASALAKGAKTKWYANIELPDTDGAICYVKDNGVFWIVIMFVEEPATKAAGRATALNAMLKLFTVQRGGIIVPGDAESPGLYKFGEGELYVDREVVGDDGYEYVSLIAQHAGK